MDTLSTQLKPAPGNNKKNKYLYFILLSFVFLVGLLGLGFYVTAYERGTIALFRSGEKLLNGAFHFRAVKGTLLKGISFYGVEYKNKEQHIEIDSLEGRWDLTVFSRQLNIDYLRLGTIKVQQLAPKPPSTPLVFPESLHLPFEFILREANIKKISIVNKNKIEEYTDIFFNAKLNSQRHHLDLTNIKSPFGALKASLHVDAAHPFKLNGKVILIQEYQKNLYTVNTTVNGSLETIDIHAKMNGDNLDGDAYLVVTPFNKIPLKTVVADIKNFNPKLFVSSLPNGNLDITADLQPKALSTSSSLLAIIGNIKINNKKPGAWDKNLFPFETIYSDINLTENQYDASNLNVKLFEGATIAGNIALKNIETTKQTSALQGEILLNLSDLNLKSLHSSLITSKLKGLTTIKIEPDKQNILLNLDGSGFVNEKKEAELLKIEANIEADSQKILFNKILLSDTQKNGAVAFFDIKGNFLRNAEAGYNFQGKVKSFNPSHWVNILAKKNQEKNKVNIPDAKINSDFEMTGHMYPQLYSKAKLNVYDSTYNQMPVLAKGQFEVKDKRLLHSNLNVMVAGNTLALHGSWGNKDDVLYLELNAPSLNKIGLGLSGFCVADAKVKGGLSQPSIYATMKVDKFSFDAYKVSKFSAKINIASQLKNEKIVFEQSRMEANLKLEGYQSSDFNINGLIIT